MGGQTAYAREHATIVTIRLDQQEGQNNEVVEKGDGHAREIDMQMSGTSSEPCAF